MEKEIGKVIHFFDKISVAIIKLEEELILGDEIKIKGATTDLNQKIESIQYEHEDIQKGKKGQEIAIKTDGLVRKGDSVFRA